MEPKLWYESKQIWVNILAAIAIFAQSKFGYVLPLEVQTQILLLLNLFLRFITKKPVVWEK